MEERPVVRDLVLWLKDLIDWVPFGENLPGIREAHIQLIQAQNRDQIGPQKRELFNKWLAICPEASYNDVVNALEIAEQPVLAANVRKMVTGESVEVDKGEKKKEKGATPPVAKTAVDVSKIIDAIKEVLDKNFAKVQNATKRSLSMIASELFAKGIITNEVQGNPTYEGIISDFKGNLDLSDTKEEVREFCQNFLKGIASEGGPAKTAANKLGDEWKRELKESLGVDMTFD
uniref:Death domain-containing protein n=1 Tax=Amphimedon queenslandica TaxID=400682 RepID=A0A1X7TZ28_AMPQE